MPFITGANKNRPHQILFWNGDGPFSAVRENDRKLITMPDRLPELYNLAEDPSEKLNLAMKEPEITRDLLQKLFAWKNSNDNAKWQLQKKYEAQVVELFDKYRK
jgi:hypothetical protein